MPLSSTHPARRLNLLLWLLGMPGVLGLVLNTLPQLMRGQGDVPPLWVVAAAGVLQTGIFLALAVWIGGRLAPKVGLASPVLQALASRQPVAPHLRAALVAGLMVAIPAGVGLFVITAKAPAEFSAAQASVDIPLL